MKQKLTEAQLRFQSLLEYNFYAPKLSEEEETPESDQDSTEDAEMTDDEANDAVDSVGQELGVDDNADETPANPEPTPAPAPTPAPQPPAEDEEELDVTELVDMSKKAAIAANRASKNTVDVMGKLADLENRLARMDALTNKIDQIEKEVITRNPTPVEKMEMRSLDSFPYNIRLSDYWKDNGMDDEPTDKPEEFVLTTKDANDYIESEIKDSFK